MPLDALAQPLPPAPVDPPDPAPAPVPPGPPAPAGPPSQPPAAAPPAAPAADPVRAAAQAAAEAAAAAALADVYKQMPGVVAELIGGQTIADVQAAYAAAQRVYGDIKQAVMRDVAALLPGGHGGTPAAPAPTDPFGLIAAGLQSGPPKK